jgi:hypothetical protein
MISLANVRVSLFDRSAAQNWMQHAAAGLPVSALEHNSGVIAYTMLMDSIANPPLAAGQAPGTAMYGTTMYLGGDFPAYINQRIPLVGEFDAPLDADALKWWNALGQFVRRISDGVTSIAAPAGFAPTIGSPTLYEVRGDNSSAIIPSRQINATIAYLEDPNTASEAANLYMAAYLYAETRTAANGGPIAASDISAMEANEAPVVTQLATEALAERSTARRNGVLILAGGVAAAVGAGLLLGRK